jgi:DNA (cytosine-5)-methyltransferase 1
VARLIGLDLFSGVGGIGEALAPWVNTKAFCEIEPYARALLFSRMKRGEIDAAPIHVDVSRLNAESLAEIGVNKLDIIFGGFPCTDISMAGERKGINQATRSGLFFQIARLLGEMKPRYVMLENVAAIRSMGIGLVEAELHAQGYDCRYGVLSAYDVGACHRRDRWWLLGRRRDAAPVIHFDQRKTEPHPNADDLFGVVNEWVGGTWEIGIPRLTEEKEHRADRLRMLGNSVVPQCAREAFLRLSGIGGICGFDK